MINNVDKIYSTIAIFFPLEIMEWERTESGLERQETWTSKTLTGCSQRPSNGSERERKRASWDERRSFAELAIPADVFCGLCKNLLFNEALKKMSQGSLSR